MKPEVKALWLAALRSGEYTQGKGALRARTHWRDAAPTLEHCCLGVLCDVYHKATGLGKWDGDTFFISDTDQNENVLPPSVVEWSGLPDANPSLSGDRDPDHDSLAGANDHGATFDEIADIVENEF